MIEKLKPLACALTLSITTLSCGGGPTRGGSLTVTGTVTSMSTRAGLEGLRVEVASGPSEGRSTTTDAAGRFQLDVESSSFTLRVRGGDRFEDESRALSSVASTVPFALKRRPCSTPSCVNEPNGCNEVLPLLRPPFDGDFRVAAEFDHRKPLGFSGNNDGVFVRFCGSAGAYDGHGGWDWIMPVGTPILAPADGTVTFAGKENPFLCPFLGREVAANFVEIQHRSPHGEIFWTQSLHLDRILVARGELVVAGQTIAYSGNTGCSTGPHLHFAVFRERFGGSGGVATDPFGWQGQGTDPWAEDADGAPSAWLWATAAPRSFSAGAPVLEMHNLPSRVRRLEP